MQQEYEFMDGMTSLFTGEMRAISPIHMPRLSEVSELKGQGLRG